MTEQGPVAAATVVLAAGMWSRELAAAVGVSVPLHAAEHFYIVTEPLAEVPRDLPVLRVTDECTYYKEDAGKLLVGAFEPVAKPWGMDGIPEGFCFDSLPEDIDHFEPILESATAPPADPGDGRHPDLLQRPGELHPRRPLPARRDRRAARPVRRLPASTRSASRARAGPARCWRNGSATAACRSTSPTSTCAGCTRSRATAPTCATAPPRRWACSTPCTGPTGSTPPPAACGARRSTTGWWRLGAVMGETAGWERPNWYAPPGVAARVPLLLGPAELVRAHGRRMPGGARRRGPVRPVELRQVPGRGRGRLRGAEPAVGGRDGRAGRPRSSTPNGATSRAASRPTSPSPAWRETSFLVVTGAAVQTRDLAWLREHIPAEARCAVVDITSGLPMLGLMGPTLARAAASCSPARTCPTPPSRSAPRASSRSATPGSAPAGSPMSASWAGSSTSRPSSRPTCFDRIVEAGRGVRPDATPATTP